MTARLPRPRFYSAGLLAFEEHMIAHGVCPSEFARSCGYTRQWAFNLLAVTNIPEPDAAEQIQLRAGIDPTAWSTPATPEQVARIIELRPLVPEGVRGPKRKSIPPQPSLLSAENPEDSTDDGEECDDSTDAPELPGSSSKTRSTQPSAATGPSPRSPSRLRRHSST